MNPEEKMTASYLNEHIEEYDRAEILIDRQWYPIISIANYKITNGVWESDGNKIFIITDDAKEHTFQLMDMVVIRYGDESPTPLSDSMHNIPFWTAEDEEKYNADDETQKVEIVIEDDTTPITPPPPRFLSDIPW